MKASLKSCVRTYVLILVGILCFTAGAYQAIGAAITCSYCMSSRTKCNDEHVAPGGLASCYAIQQEECADHECNRCTGEFATSVRACVTVTEQWRCNLNGQQEECGWKYLKTCVYQPQGGCQCPDSGGSPAGACLFYECTGTTY